MVKKIIILAVVLLAAGAGIWFGVKHFEAEVAPPSTTIQAVPADAAFIFECRDTHNVWLKLSETNVMWEELKTTEWFTEANDLGLYMDSIFVNNQKLKKLTDKKSVVVSAHMSGANDFDFLYCVGMPGGFTATDVEAMLDEINGGKALTQKRQYDETPLVTVTLKERDIKFTYAIKNGIFISSTSTVLIEDAIRHINSGASLTNNYGFVKVQKTAGIENVDGNLYINYEVFPQVLATYLNTETKLRALPLQAFGNWSELDLILRPNGFSMNGFTYANDTTNNYLNIFKDQKPQSIEIDAIAPQNTALMLFMGLSDFEGYYNRYKTYLERNNKLFEYNRDLEKTNNACGCDLNDGIASWIGNEMALIITEPANEEIDQDIYAVFSTNNLDNALNKLELTLTQITLKEGTQADFDVYNDHMIKQLRIGNGLSKLLGGAFRGIESPYFTTIDDYIVMANSKAALRDLINNKAEDNTLDKNINYRNFCEELASEANIFVYSNIARSPNIYKQVLTKEYAQDVDTYLELYRKFEAVAVQVSNYKNNLFLNNMYLKYNPVYKQETSSLWETPLDTSISNRPQLVLNHADNTREVFVQSDDNTLNLIGSTGRVEWQRKIDEPILSDVTQIDAYNNNKLQILFNTRNKIYLIDRLGRDVPGWPVKLAAPASNKVAVMDYDKNNKHRILIACMDNKIYNYDRDGKIVTGWEFGSTQSRVIANIQHTVINNKDYIFVADIAGNIYLLDRRGKERHQANAKITGRSNNPFYLEKGVDINSTKVVYTDTLGNVVKLQFAGNVERINLGTFSSDHYFVYGDIDNDKRSDYIILDKQTLAVFGGDQQPMFGYEFDSTATHPPILFRLSGNVKKLGVVIEKMQKVFLFNQVGDVSAGFPLYGSTLMDIGDMNRDDALNLVIGSSDGQIYTYTLK